MGNQGPGNPLLIDTKPIVEQFSSSANTVNAALNKVKNLARTTTPSRILSRDGTVEMKCIVFTKRRGSLETMTRTIEISKVAGNKIKLFSGKDQAAIFEFMYPSGVEKRAGSSVVWASNSYINKECHAYVTFSAKLKALVCFSTDVMETPAGKLTKEGTVLLSFLNATIQSQAHMAYRIKLKARGDPKIVKSPVKLTPRACRFIFGTAVGNFFNNGR